MKTKEKTKLDQNILKESRSFDVRELFNEYIKHPAHRIIIWSWGANNWQIMQDKALRFNVNGAKHKGRVYITLDHSDTFTIYYTSIQDNIKKVSEGIYIDQLIEVLDTDIETEK